MATRSHALLATLATLVCVAGLAQWLGLPADESRSALDGPTREDVGGQATGSADLAPFVAPAPAGRVSADSSAVAAAVESRGLVVRLRDPAGAPIDGVHVRFAPTNIARILPPTHVHYVRTDAVGEARLGERDLDALFGGEAGGRVSIECLSELPTATQRVSVARRPLSGQPIDLVIDAIPVHVGALLPGGERWEGQLGVSWRYERGMHDSMLGVSPVRVWLVRGEPYLVRVFRAELYEDVDASFPAITALERERAHDLQLDESFAGLRITLRTSDGALLPEHTQIELRSDRNQGDGDESATRADGEVRFRVRPARDAATQRTVWLVALGRGALGHGQWRKQVTYDVPPAGEWTDLGEVTLETEPLLVAGKVVTPAGVPVEGIGVQVESIDADGRWSRLPDLGNCLWLDDTGAFAVHGPAPDAPLRVRALLVFRDDLDGHAVVLPPLTSPGSTDVVVRIVEAGAVRFHVVGGDDLTYEQFDICSMPEDGTEPRTLDESEIHRTVDEEVDGRFVVRRLPPGKVSITLRAERGAVALGAPLHASIHAGETTDAGALVLDDRVRWVELTVTEHAWVSADIVRYGPHGGPLTLRAEVQANGVARLGLRDAGGVDVLVGGESLAPVFLADVEAPCVVTLEAYPAVTFEVAGLTQLATALGDAANGRALVVQLTPQGGEPWLALAEPALLCRQRFDVPLDELERMSEPASLHVAPGRYAVTAAIIPRWHAHERWHGPEHGFRFTALGELEVMPALSPQAARIQVDPTLR